MLEDEEPLDVVFPQFLEWIRTTREEVSKRTGDQYYTGKTNGTIHLIVFTRHFCSTNSVSFSQSLFFRDTGAAS